MVSGSTDEPVLDLGGTRARAALAVELLVEAGAVLAASLEPTVTMRQVAELTVPRLADLCVIDLLDESGSIRGMAVVARDADVERGLVALRSRYPLDPSSGHPVARSVRSGEPILLPNVTDQELRRWARSGPHADFMIANRYRSVIVAPLVARNRTLGVLSVLRFGEREGFGQPELDLVIELARRAALAIDNGRLYSELRSLEQRLEAILAGLAEAITVIDEHGTMVFANQAAAELLGVPSPLDLTSHAPAEVMRRYLVYDEDGRALDLADMPSRQMLRGDPAPPLLVRNVRPETGEERWLVVRASPVRDSESGRITHVVSVLEDVTELKRAELAERFLADASRLLAGSSDYRQTLDLVARLAVARIADWCAVDVVGDGGSIERVATHSSGSDVPDLAAALPSTRPSLEDGTGIGALIRAALVQCSPAIEPHARSADEYTGTLRAAGAAAVVVVPMVAGRRTVGAITLASARTLRRFASADLALAQELGRRAGTAIENARRYSERTRIAHILQQALLPQSFPVSEALEVHAVYEAVGELNEVGGDFYDVLEYDAGRWLVLIGDVCGKGPRAAGMTALARHTLRAAAINGQAPTGMLETLHAALRRHGSGTEPCTACVVLLEPGEARARLTVALGGHHPPLLIGRDSDPVPVGRTGTLLGAVDPITVHETEAELRAGQTLLLYTDGVVDAGRPHRPLGESGLTELCRQTARHALEPMLEHIRAATVEHAGGTLRDDLALLAVRLR